MFAFPSVVVAGMFLLLENVGGQPPVGRFLASRNLRANDGPNVVTAPAGIYLMNGFDLQSGKLSSAIIDREQLKNCTDDPSAACVEWSNTPQSVSSTFLVTDKNSYSQMLSSITGAEGAGWGVKVSASVSYLAKSKVSSNSVDLVCWGAFDVTTATIRNLDKARLNDAAKYLLETDPEQFLENYGTHYVQQIVYGGSFVGSFHLTEGRASDTQDLSIVASAKYKDAFFNVAVSEDFQQKTNSSSTHIESLSDIKTHGGDSCVWQNGKPPNYMGDLFNEWQKSLNAQNSLKLRIVLQSWYNFLDVQEIVKTMDPTMQRRFTVNALVKNTVDAIAAEVQAIEYVFNGVKSTQKWSCVSNITKFKNQLASLETDVSAKRNYFQSLSESEALDIQTNIRNRNTTWKSSGHLSERLAQLKDAYSSECSDDTTPAFFGGAYSVDDCRTNTYPNPKTGGANCPSDYVAKNEGRWKAPESNCGVNFFVCHYAKPGIQALQGNYGGVYQKPDYSHIHHGRVNAVTGDMSCPHGFTAHGAARVLTPEAPSIGAYLYQCIPTSGLPGKGVFGGFHTTPDNGQSIGLVVNPFTGSTSCPHGYKQYTVGRVKVPEGSQWGAVLSLCLNVSAPMYRL